MTVAGNYHASVANGGDIDRQHSLLFAAIIRWSWFQTIYSLAIGQEPSGHAVSYPYHGTTKTGCIKDPLVGFSKAGHININEPMIDRSGYPGTSHRNRRAGGAR
ncbi:uncharacterized protein LOC126576618 [Anopheles aquasalis]|uniref:uncharacterized protein LOC126576618 n=1 Tax=Anopheles aquasalis TaxID=42839 RepID=UPI00215AC365|nr:uncharacterized protein LOC126576618 [Anopheles aquasalis]